MNQDLTMPNSLLCRTTNNRQLLFSKSKLNMAPVVPKNQTADKTVSYPKILNNYVKNSGFPNFVEVV